MYSAGICLLLQLAGPQVTVIAGPATPTGTDRVVQGNPVFVSSGDLIADRRYKWALDYLARGDALGAVDILQQAIELAPEFASAWFALGAVRERQGDRAGAIAAYQYARKADSDDYHGAELHLARLGSGEVGPDRVARYVRRLFDQHAAGFDQSLLNELDYCGPALLHAAVCSVAAGLGRGPRFSAMLDLGCGTGLAGVEFRPMVDRLLGVDLSAGMVAEASRKAIYDQVEVVELMEYLTVESAAGNGFDLVIAADVFVYLANLNDVIAMVGQVLRRSGLFAFTVETFDGAGVLLQASLRYAHTAGHLRDAVANAGLELRDLRQVATRTENGKPVPGLLVVARRE
jgi:predicted TPR repeat methyltransferase